jgi:hypothetical protein
MVCDPVGPPAPRLSRPEPDSLEAAAKRAAQVVKLVADNRVSAANKRLHRPDVAPKPIREAYEDLIPLHPQGAPPTNIVLPETPLYGPGTVPTNAVREIVSHSRKESSPGPSGWTFELLDVALRDAAFAESFRNLMIDICNGALPAAVDLVLAHSNLIGIPKETGGTRPIAMGDVFLKVAAQIAMKREESNLRSIFYGTQYGVGTKNGAEIIIHDTREFVRNGPLPDKTSVGGKMRVLFTLDASNAFNSPTRESMHQAIVAYNVPGLLGIFKTAYAQKSTLFIVGSNGELSLTSSNGSKQGETSSGMCFSLVVQPGLDEIRDNHEKSAAKAYLDDISAMSTDPYAAHLALLALDARLRSKGISLNYKKCEVLMPGLVEDGPDDTYVARVAAALTAAGVPADSPLRHFRIATVVKILGAHISTSSAREEAALLAKAKPKIDAQLARVRELPASPQALIIVRQCFLATQMHNARVHHPDTTARLMSYVDAKSQLLIRDWAQCQQFGAAQQAIYIAPTRQGGLGMVSLSITAPAAHAASILNYRCTKNGQKCTITQSQINQACLEEAHKQLAVRDPSFVAHLENTKHGGSILTTSHAARASEDITAAALRILLKSPSVNAASSSASTYACPGCSSTSIGRRANNLAAAASARSSAPSLSVEQYMHHALGCAAMPGGAVTKRHNAILVVRHSAQLRLRRRRQGTEKPSFLRLSLRFASLARRLRHSQQVLQKSN